MQQKIGQSIAKMSAAGSRLALLLLEIDRFKDINDTFGHSVADRILVQIADRVRSQLRQVDIVGRFGGDALVIILPHSDAAHAATVATRVVDEVAKPFAVAELLLPISVHVGISLYPENGINAETLLKRADAALCRGRAAGRKTITLYEREVADGAQEHVILGAALREAVSEGQLTLRYQPQIKLSDGTLHGVEALVRWAHPILGDISTSRFILIAEQIGLIEEIGIWALGEACRQMAAWRAAGRNVPAISVNLSPLHFRNHDLPDIIAHLLSRYDIPQHALMLEITEGVMMDEQPATMAIISDIRALGVGLSMDDFGTGYSSLSRLTQIPFSEIKIDRSFTVRLEQDRGARAIVTAINDIGQSLGMTVVAEGIETEQQRKILKELGCQIGQGYLFSHPLNAIDLEDWLAVPTACVVKAA
jgi:diguanylate cyclase (GGDEF)-like protein